MMKIALLNDIKVKLAAALLLFSKPANALGGCGLPFSDVEFYNLPGAEYSHYFALSIGVDNAKSLLANITTTCQAFLQIDTNSEHKKSICWQNNGRYYSPQDGFFKSEVAAVSVTWLSEIGESQLGHNAAAPQPWGCINGVLNDGIKTDYTVPTLLIAGGAGAMLILLLLIMVRCMKKNPEKTPLLAKADEPHPPEGDPSTGELKV